MIENVSDAVRELLDRLAAIQAGTAVVGTSPTGVVDPLGAEPAAAGVDAHARSLPAPGGSTDPRSVPAMGDSTDSQVLREEVQLAKAICLRLLTDAALPRAGLEQRLLRRGISPEAAGLVLDRFTNLGLIDDQSYAEAFVRSKHRERALARTALAAELRRKGVDDETAMGALELIDGGSEETRAAELIAKRVRSAVAAGPEAARRRLLALLDRRGYSAEMSIRVVDEALAANSDSSRN